ncbi:response regulator [Pelagovum pacificum]|uniref:Response regulator n=1 Tax=Pelagovum pacificum TaxID=2588711 RepID=A0A5C5G7I0_9RHOB|nr:response regulator [Pelagovum pacificum]QQA41890.1 response regulator [Pelagovum pacificum]TNY30669.1 response regulator [Pelagovum pacificum]
MSLKETLRVMVVDDMSTSRGLITQALEEIGIWHVQAESDARAGLAKLAASPVHLVLSDLNMPNMDGLQFLAALRQTKSTQKIGFILVTGSPNRELIQKAQTLGLNNMIKKPFTTDSMRTCIERVVGRL